MNENEIRERLSHCFALAFPKLDASRRVTASTENTSGWDSVAQVTLLTLIGEEFGIEVDFEEFEGATSFEALASRISQMISAST
ncbi:MAG: acyl carrier protein [Candidatus Sulfotelmatobacter sp.]